MGPYEELFKRMLCDFSQEFVLKHEQLENLTPNSLHFMHKARLFSFFSLLWFSCFAASLKHEITFYLIMGQIFTKGFLCVRNCAKPWGYEEEKIWCQHSIVSTELIISNMPIKCYFSQCCLTCPKSFFKMLIIQVMALTFFKVSLPLHMSSAYLLGDNVFKMLSL